MKAELFDMLNKDNQIEKKSFSFTYWVNGKEVQHVTPSRLLLQAVMIYGAISCGLFELEHGRK
tara:strand:+ start:322 stop:510 length:189 start_codon:yes stop_codon:yes gene_type:complete